MIIKCITCGIDVETRFKNKLYCNECLRKRKIQQVMKARKKRFPDIEIGVGSGNSSKNRGTTHGSWKTGITGYRNMIKKDYCRQCGSTKHLCVHHIDENRCNNCLENLTILCKKCHQKLHTKRDQITGQYMAK